MLDWLQRFPEELLDADPRLLLVKAWLSALRAREDDMRSAAAASASSAAWTTGPLPDGFASLGSSLVRAGRDVRVGRRGSILEPARGRPSSKGPESPWRPVITWALGWAHYCNGDSGRPSGG